MSTESGVEAQINYLLYNQLIKRISKNKLNINGKGRLYNQDKPPSKILTKAVGSLYKKQFPQESKPKRRIRNVKDKPAGSTDVLLNYSEPIVKDGLRKVDTEKFKDFTDDHEALQKIKTDPLVVELKFRIVTQTKQLIKESKVKPSEISETTEAFYGGDDEFLVYIKGKVEISEEFIKQETVYGGEQGLRLYLKNQVIKLVYMFEDSGTHIKSMTLTNVCFEKK